jgi:penicillin-binding protein 1A
LTWKVAFWLEAWLSKDEILSRYLSNVYFGDNVYGLRAAAKHYFNRKPEDLTIGQAAMLAGLVKAPSRLAPTGNLEGARARQKLVIGAMVEAGFMTKAQAADVRPRDLSAPDSRCPTAPISPTGCCPQARDRAGEIGTETDRADDARQCGCSAPPSARWRAPGCEGADRHRRDAPRWPGRGDGRRQSYGDSPFNRATQARRQPGSAFKLFVYLAAMRAG